MSGVVVIVSVGCAFVACAAAFFADRSLKRIQSIEDAIYRRLDQEFEFVVDCDPIPEPTVTDKEVP